jgi:hypothetical protein
MRHPAHSIQVALTVVVASGALILPACETNSQSVAPAKTASPSEAPDVYIVRGQVEDLPDPTRAGSAFSLHHEAIDNFVSPSGSVGMNAMTMDLPLAAGVSAADLRVGDFVEVLLEVRLKPKISYQVTRVTRLPADTKLEFRAARPPASGSAPAK